MDPKMKHAMSSVLESMGRAAREGKARRYNKNAHPVEVQMGEVTLEPTSEAKREHAMMGAHADQEVDPLKTDASDEEMAEMMKDLEVQR